ncbi:hypothetical protein GH975_04770 [Litorivicinus lipolyticus]|uniref:Uncharacterized protein n=1 Tax=Litorivicinus lipolyticus TaxID=418701 RepID=A0A5Q2QD60_9GAMM|nr:hypothetical protein [Litorivicinus lipolyticus]QGG79927.1 hypothetical protein GH975_04770 [Litorivicinus lipolyticus]
MNYHNHDEIHLAARRLRAEYATAAIIRAVKFAVKTLTKKRAITATGVKPAAAL